MAELVDLPAGLTAVRYVRQARTTMNTRYFLLADVAELVDAHDSKSCGGNIMWVRFPPSALLKVCDYILKIKVCNLQ